MTLTLFAWPVQAAENYRAHSTSATLQRSSATQEAERLRAEYQQLQRERDQVMAQAQSFSLLQKKMFHAYKEMVLLGQREDPAKDLSNCKSYFEREGEKH